MRRIVLSLIIAIVGLTAVAVDFDPLSASIEENITQPVVPRKKAQIVREGMAVLMRTLRNAGFAVTTVRDGEVVLINIPAGEIFASGSTELRDAAAATLSPLMPYIKRNDHFKVIVAVHSDNTGDELYNERLTADRANAVDDFYYRLNNNQETNIIPYGLGNDEPIASNNSVSGRAKNRRIEIYFVPTEEYINNVRRRQ